MKKMMRPLVLYLMIAILALSMAGCTAASGSAAGGAPPASAAGPEFREYTDTLGRTVKLPTEIKKIVAVRYMDLNMLASVLGADFDEKMVSLGGSVQVNDFDNYRKFSEAFDLDSLVLMDGLYNDSIDVESMLELEPDLIVVDVQFQKTNSVQKMLEVGLPVVFTNMAADAVYGPLETMEMLGEMLGKSEVTSEMVNYSREKIDSVLARVDALVAGGAKKPTVYFECGNTPPGEIGQTRADKVEGWGIICDALGAENIGDGHNRQVLDPEIVLASDPDVIIIGGANWNMDSNIMRMGYFVTPEATGAHLGEYITARAGWDQLSAIQNERLYSVHFHTAVYPFHFAVIEAMAQMLWPEEFGDLDPEADLEEFFAKYMPVEYSGRFFGGWTNE